jgi:D-sedoheptulose 7-phosphate isomerase
MISPERAQVFEQAIVAHLGVIGALREQVNILEQIAAEMTRAVLNGKKVLWCGNGGSAADSQHLAAEFVGRFRRERRAMASIALTTDTSILTAIGNDYGYEHVFARQVEALCVPGDVLVGISTSGNSRSTLLAVQAARKQGAFAVAFTGNDGGEVARFADATLRIPSRDTARIQEGHILCGHMICDWVEMHLCQHLAGEKEVVE